MIDYLFYFLQAKYKKWGEVDVPKVYALVIITLLQFVNLLSVLLCGVILEILSIKLLEKKTALITFALILLANYFYIFQIRGSNAIIARQAQKEIRNRNLKVFALSYIIGSIVLIVILMTVHLRN